MCVGVTNTLYELNKHKNSSFSHLVYWHPFIHVGGERRLNTLTTMSLCLLQNKKHADDQIQCTYCVSCGRQWCSLNRRLFTTSVVPQNNLTRICATDNQIRMKLGKCDRCHTRLKRKGFKTSTCKKASSLGNTRFMF